MNKRIIIAIALVALISIFVVIALKDVNWFNNGVVRTKGIGVYWNYNCTTKVTSIEWGDVYEGESYNRTVYVKNEGNVPLELSLTTLDWNPRHASDYINETWNRDGYILGETEVIDALIILNISENVENVTTFSFITLVSG